jgi:DNA transformation protein
MTVSPGFRAFVLDQLGRVVKNLHARNMFGGVGIYAGELFFALVDDDVLYLKVDETNRGDFERAGTGPFRPSGEGGEVMQYYEVPADVLEDTEALTEWAGKAIDVARRARRRKTR